MSTQINVTVDSGGLSAKAKQQQEAARLAQLERERTRRVETEAKSKRNASQAAKGLDAKGQSLYGAPFTPPRPLEEPAAFPANPLELGEGYFTVSRGTHDVAVLKVTSGDGSTSITHEVSGSEAPEGFRDQAGVDAAPHLPIVVGATVQNPYFVRVGNTVTYHVGYRRDASGNFVVINASSTNGGGWAQFESEWFTDLIVLPVNASTAIFAFAQNRFSYKTYSIHTETKTGSAFQGTAAIEASDELIASEQVTSRVKVAFLVSRKTVREINYPDELYAACIAAGYFIDWKYSVESLEAVNTPSYFKVTGNDSIAGGGQPIGYYTGIGDYYFNDTQYPDIGSTAEIISWGLKQDVSLTEQASADRVSPGIYDVLNGESIPNYLYPEVPRFSEVKEAINSTGLRVKWVRLNKDDLSDKTYAEQYADELPEFYVVSEFNADKFRKARVKAGLLLGRRFNDQDYYRWTDWGNPAYCRQQALALGFTAADLTP